jgi:hypothetical protein
MEITFNLHPRLISEPLQMTLALPWLLARAGTVASGLCHIVQRKFQQRFCDTWGWRCNRKLSRSISHLSIVRRGQHWALPSWSDGSERAPSATRSVHRRSGEVLKGILKSSNFDRKPISCGCLMLLNAAPSLSAKVLSAALPLPKRYNIGQCSLSSRGNKK